MEQLRVADAMTEIFNLFKRCNKYIDETMPWALAKDETKQDRLATVLYNLVEGITIGRVASGALYAGDDRGKILAQLNAPKRRFEELGPVRQVPVRQQGDGQAGDPLSRLDLKEVLEKVEELQRPRRQRAAPAKGKKGRTGYRESRARSRRSPIDDFAKLQFQVGEIIACEEVKKSKKLLCSR